MELPRGARLGAYEVASLVGRGGSGSVYRGRDGKGSEVALKVLESPSPDARDRFARERRLLGELGAKEGFVPLLDADPRGGFIVMPFLGGGTLRARLERGPLGVEATVELGRTLALALGRAHARGIVHRDMKPENVLFDAGGAPLIADLGLAKHFRSDTPGATLSVQLSASADLRGTFGYMPLEQMQGAKRVGPAADVFALGAILYECLAGVPAFSGTSALELMHRIETGGFTALRELRPETPTAVANAIERALARDPDARFEDGAAFARALGAEHLAPRRRPLLVVTMVGLVAALAGALFLANRRQPEVAPAELSSEKPRHGVAPVRAVAFAALGGKLHLLVGEDRALRVIVPETAAEILAIPQSQPVHDVAAGPDSIVLVGLTNGAAVGWDLGAEPRQVASCTEHTGRVSVAFTSDGTGALSVGEEGDFREWDPRRAGPSVLLSKIRGPKPRFLVCRDVDGVGYGGDGEVGVIDTLHKNSFIRNGRARGKESTTGGAFLLGPLADRHWFATVGSDGTIAVQNTLLELLATAIVARTEGDMSIRALPDGSVVTCAPDGECQQWIPVGPESHLVLVRGQSVKTRSRPTALAVSADGRLLATGGADGTVSLFDLATKPWRELGPRGQ